MGWQIALQLAVLTSKIARIDYPKEWYPIRPPSKLIQNSATFMGF